MYIHDNRNTNLSHASVFQIRKSPQARKYFDKCCTEVEVSVLELLKWIRTRWASLFKMLERMLRLRKVSTLLLFKVLFLLTKFQGVNRFTLTADDSEEVPDLQGKTYAAFKLSTAEWEKMSLMRDVLQVIVLFSARYQNFRSHWHT